MVYPVSGLKRDHLVQCNYLKHSFYLHFRKVIRHSAVCWFSCHNRKPSSSLKVPYIDLQWNRDSNMPHCTSYICSNGAGKDSISKLSFCYPLNQPELKQWSSEFVGTVTDTMTEWVMRPDCQQPPNLSSCILHTYLHYVIKMAHLWMRTIIKFTYCICIREIV